MANLTAVIVPAKVLKDGRHKIRISVSHNGKTRYIVTDIVVDSAREFSNGRVVRRHDAGYLNTKLGKLLSRYQETLDEIEAANCLSCEELVEWIKTNAYQKHISIREVYDEYLSNTSAKPSSINNYKYSWNAVSALINPDLPIETVSHLTVTKIIAELKKRKLKNGTIGNYLTFFKTLIKYAVSVGYVEFKRDPFFGFTKPKADIRQSWISIEDVKLIRDYEPIKANLKFYKDMFMLSYYLGGINLRDILKIKFDVASRKISYIRSKVEGRVTRPVEFYMPDEAVTIISRYISESGYLRYKKLKPHRILVIATYNMQRIARILNIDNLVFYSARKSFNQHAFELGIPDGVRDYLLGHSTGKNGSSLLHYQYVTPQMATDALRKVLDNLK